MNDFQKIINIKRALKCFDFKVIKGRIQISPVCDLFTDIQYVTKLYDQLRRLRKNLGYVPTNSIQSKICSEYTKLLKNDSWLSKIILNENEQKFFRHKITFDKYWKYIIKKGWGRDTYKIIIKASPMDITHEFGYEYFKVDIVEHNRKKQQFLVGEPITKQFAVRTAIHIAEKAVQNKISKQAIKFLDIK